VIDKEEEFELFFSVKKLNRLRMTYNRPKMNIFENFKKRKGITFLI